MTIEARWNLQRGVPEDKRYPAKNYTPESPLDYWLLSREKMRRELLGKRETNIMAQAAAKDAAKELEKLIDKELDKLLKDFNKK